MIKRIVEISNPSFVHLRMNQMVVEQEGKEVGTVPVEDLGLLILDNPQVSVSRALLSACAALNIVVLVSNDKHLPGSMLVPIEGNALQSRIITVQAEAGSPVKKRLWQQVVKEKIRGQARVLQAVCGSPDPLDALVGEVTSGDKTNVEGRAASLYWRRLFGSDFRRDPELEGRNALLNYGYAIIRAAVARALVGSGLHPSLGIHHHNQYDAFCLADDMMEPFRPLVDLKVARLTADKKDEVEVDAESKSELLGLLNLLVYSGKRPLPLMVALHSMSASLARALEGVDDLEIPVWSTEQ